MLSPVITRCKTRVCYGMVLLATFGCAGRYDIVPAVPKPSIEALSSTCGRGGETITISGVNFSEVATQNIVRFNGTQAVVTQSTKTSLRVTVPARSGNGVVTVAIRDATGTGPVFSNLPTGTATIAGELGPQIPEDVGMMGLAADNSGVLITSRINSARIERMTPSGSFTLVAGGGADGESSGYRNGVGGDALFESPADVVVDSKGNIYVADSYNHCIRKIDPAGVVTLYAGVFSPQTGRPAQGFKDGPRTEAILGFPTGLAIDDRDNIYFADQSNQRIRKITPDNGIVPGTVSTIAGTTFGAADGPVNVAQLGNVLDVAIDSLGNIYFTEEMQHPAIRKISADGIVTTLMKGYDDVYYGCRNDTYILDGAFGICTGKNGNIYALVNVGAADLDDWYTYKIIVITPQNFVGVVAGGGSTDADSEGVGEEVNFPERGRLVILGDDVYVTQNRSLIRVELN